MEHVEAFKKGALRSLCMSALEGGGEKRGSLFFLLVY